MTSADIQKLINKPGGYRLSEGVYATRSGLEFDPMIADELAGFVGGPFLVGDTLLGWRPAAKRLRYQKGQPWCWSGASSGCDIACYAPAINTKGGRPNSTRRLHRIAALLCDTSGAFLVLHWCITELGV